MRFVVRADRSIVVAFEPTAAEHRLEPGSVMTVEWFGGGDDGMVSMEAEYLVIAAPTGGYTRAWESDGMEIYIGAESGSEAH
ncbi:hypothetical protein RM844_15330 [Streptomyces sp. DSM 44915]|uniref:Uncharacterized protein n=1 Tax=Streptomyces chisholmiae TaxID=3075540 RepID=A0ABU2JRP4_9ACTN|nr:hypothetical protein [Streptomyces sp. DSM 44915]MDT0267659.1 hypothetical protein [Streptomyces sp. DSM 44915]